MKKLLLLIFLWGCLMASDWKIVTPFSADDVNECTNPSVEINTTNHAATSTNTITQSTEQQYLGAYSLKCTRGAASSSVFATSYSHTFLNANTTYYLKAKIYVPSDWDGGNIFFGVANLTGAVGTTVQQWVSGTSQTGLWYEISATVALASDVTGVINVEYASGATDGRYFYVDALYISTNNGLYFDGDSPLAFWKGNRHASASQMDYRNRKHGSLLDLQTSNYIYLSEPSGADFAPHELNNRARAIGRGAEHGNTYLGQRPLIFPVTIDGRNSLATYHSNKKVLENAVKFNRSPNDQSFTMQYIGANANVPAYIDVRTAGLDLARYGYSGQGQLRLIAEDPGYYEAGDHYTAMTRSTSLSVSYILGWLNDGTGFSALGNTGTGQVNTIAIAGNGDMYLGGTFTNWDANADADRIVKYSRSAGTWSHLFSSGASGSISDIIILDDGDLVIVGNYTNLGGASHNYAARWDGSTISDFGSGFNGSVVAVAFDYKHGILYFGGNFTLAGGVADTAHVAQYTLSTGVFTPMQTGVNGLVNDLYVDPVSGDVYAVGLFSSASAITASNAARWEYSTQSWKVVGSYDQTTGEGAEGFDAETYTVTGDGKYIYFGGSFANTEGGNPVVLSRIARYLPGRFNVQEQLGNGLSGGNVYFLYWDTVLNKLLISGAFSSIGTRATDPAVYWNGSTFEKVPLDFPGSTTIYSFARNPVNGDYFYGFNTTGTMLVPGALNSITNNGTDDAYPTFVFDSSADVIGTEYATLTTLANRTTGAVINFNDVRILAGSIVTVEFSPQGCKIYRLVGQSKVDLTAGAIVRDSDVSAFSLMPGLNQILLSAMDTSGTPTISCYCLYKHRHHSLSGTAA